MATPNLRAAVNVQGRNGDYKSIFKSGGVSGTYDAGAYSHDYIATSSDCGISTTIVETTTERTWGFSQTAPGVTQASVKAGFVFLATGNYQVIESGTTKTVAAAFTAGDIFEVTIEDTATTQIIKYYRTPFATGVRTLVYTSLIASATIAALFPLYMNCLLKTTAATLSVLTITGAQLVVVAPVDPDYTLYLPRSFYGGWWGGATSQAAIGDGYGQGAFLGGG